MGKRGPRPRLPHPPGQERRPGPHRPAALASSGETDLYTIQKLLGHRTPLMTARYSHLHDEALRRGVDIMGRLAGKKEDTAGGGGGEGGDQGKSPPKERGASEI